MQIIVSGKFSDDVSEAGLVAANKLRQLVNSTDISDVQTNLLSMVFFPVILCDDLGIETKSHRSHSRKEGAEFVNVEIDHREWIRASAGVQFELTFEALKNALKDTKSVFVSSAAVAEIIDRLENASGR